MSALGVVASKAAISTGTGGIKTLIQIVAPANQRLEVQEIGIGFHGTNNTAEPILVQLIYQSTAGTMSALTLVLDDPDLQETIQSTAQYNASAEPTSGNVARQWTVHPQNLWAFAWNPGRGPKVKGGTRIAIAVSNNGTAINCDPYIKFEE